jgi:hypothetical protein
MSNEKDQQQAPFHGYKFNYDEENKPAETAQNNAAQYHYVGNGNGNANHGDDKFLRLVMLMFSSIMLSVAMLSGAYVAISTVWLHDPHISDHLFPILVVVGLAYLVGWIVALVGIRVFNNLVLPYVMQIYAWSTLVGILVLYSIILDKLYAQGYENENFMKYIVVITAVFTALLGFHLLPEEHNLRPFSVPLLLFNLANLYMIVFHYVFDETVNFNFLPYDIFFFLFMTSISIFMLIRVGTLNWLRMAITRIFEKKPQEQPAVKK